MHSRPGRIPAERGFEAAGLLAFDPGDGGPVRIWSAPAPEREVPDIRAQAPAGRLLISAAGDVEESSHEGGLWRGLERWADRVARRAGVSEFPSLAPGWCTWYHYFT